MYILYIYCIYYIYVYYIYYIYYIYILTLYTFFRNAVIYIINESMKRHLKKGIQSLYIHICKKYNIHI